MTEYSRDRMREIFVSGASDPDYQPFPVSYDDLRAEAREELSDEVYASVEGAAGSEETARDNLGSFDLYRLQPDVLQDVSDRDLTTELFGHEYSAPVGLAPVGVQSIVHDDGEPGSASAAADLELPFAASTVSSTPLEETAAEYQGAWFQLYPSSDRELTRSLLDRAEEAGYGAVVVTVDAPLFGWRTRALREAYLPFLDGEGIANYTTDQVFRDRLHKPPEDDSFAAVQEFIDVFSDPSLDWESVDYVLDHTDLPVVVKGVLSADDAARALDAGFDGVWVSNHGGRQVDGSVSSLEVLPEVADEVDDRVPVLFDGGVRGGADVVKALAMGADAAFVGRPYVYGLAVGGESGVRDVMRNLRADLDSTLGLCGLSSVDDVDEDVMYGDVEQES